MLQQILAECSLLFLDGILLHGVAMLVHAFTSGELDCFHTGNINHAALKIYLQESHDDLFFLHFCLAEGDAFLALAVEMKIQQLCGFYRLLFLAFFFFRKIRKFLFIVFLSV